MIKNGWHSILRCGIIIAGSMLFHFGYSQDPESFNPMAGRVDVIHYDLEIRLNPPDGDIQGKLRASLRVLKPVYEIQFDFEGLVLDSMFCSSLPLTYLRVDNMIRIQSKRRIPKHKELNLEFHYHGKPLDGLIIKNGAQGFTAFADNWASRARNWFPCIDHPSDKASFQSTVHVPGRYQVIGNGTSRSDVVMNGWRTAIHRIDQPIATYCMVIGVSSFAVTKTESRGGIPIWYYSYPKDSANALVQYSRVPDMVHFFDSLIGPYPYDQLAMVQSSTRYGGMENSSAIFLSDRGGLFNALSDAEGLLAHEISHQWFGDALTETSWAEVWLSEGFATYFSALYFESRDGQIKFDSILKKAKSSYVAQPVHAYPVVYNGYPELNQLLNAENYQKGGLFLHALRLRLGDSAFFNSIRTYYSRFKHKNVTSADFRTVLEGYGHQDLKAMFKRWLETPGLPEP